jgi:hypothetical protein
MSRSIGKPNVRIAAVAKASSIAWFFISFP